MNRRKFIKGLVRVGSVGIIVSAAPTIFLPPFPNRSILIPKNKLHQVPSLASLLTSVQPMTGQTGEKLPIIVRYE